MGFHGFQKNLILNKNAVSKMNTDGITRFVILYFLTTFIKRSVLYVVFKSNHTLYFLLCCTLETVSLGFPR